MSLKIGFVCCEYPPGPCGGIGTSTQALARALVRAGNQVNVVGIYPENYPAPDEEDDHGVRITRLRSPARRLGWLRNRYRLQRFVSRWSASGKIDLIDVPDYQGWSALWPRMRIPVVSRLCGSHSFFASELQQPVDRATWLLEKGSVRRADFWCSKSKYMAERTKHMFGLKTEPSAIVYNAVTVQNPPVFSARKQDRVVFSGTLTMKKGVISLIKAWPLVQAAVPDAILDIYGKDGRAADGASMRENLRRMLPEPLRETVHFHGHVEQSQVIDALMNARVAVFPSYAEGFANAPLESMGCGAPTIYSVRGSGQELICNGVDGLLIDPDQIENLGQAMIKLLTDNRLAERLGNAGFLKVKENFSESEIVRRNKAFYRDSLNRFGEPCSGMTGS